MGWLSALSRFRFPVLWFQFRHRNFIAQSRKQIPLMVSILVAPKGRKTMPQAWWSFGHLPKLGM
jgi:hypothetical protein